MGPVEASQATPPHQMGNTTKINDDGEVGKIEWSDTRTVERGGTGDMMVVTGVRAQAVMKPEVCMDIRNLCC